MSEQLRLVAEHSPDYDAQSKTERAEYLDRLRQHLQDPDFRAIEGFP
nr:hypothetical protein [Chloroflexota bacterium]